MISYSIYHGFRKQYGQNVLVDSWFYPIVLFCSPNHFFASVAGYKLHFEFASQMGWKNVLYVTNNVLAFFCFLDLKLTIQRIEYNSLSK